MNQKALMQQVARMQAELQRVQQEIAEAEVTGTAGGGMVTVTMTGGGEVRAVTIDPKAVDPDDVEMLQDLVLAAINDAKRAGDQLQSEKMAPFQAAMGGLGGSLGIPGL